MTPVQNQTETAGARVDGHRMAPPGSRSADEIRRDIVQQRQQLSRSVDALRNRVSEATNIRHQISRHRTELLVGAAAVGFLIGGAIALKRRRG